MTAATSSPPAVFDALTSVVSGVWRIFHGEDALHRWLWPTAHEIGDYLLKAESLADLDERLDICIEEREGLLIPPPGSPFLPSGGPSRSAAEIAELLEGSTASTQKRLTVVLGDAAAARWVVGWRGFASLARFVEALKGSAAFNALPKTAAAPLLGERQNAVREIMYSVGYAVPAGVLGPHQGGRSLDSDPAHVRGAAQGPAVACACPR